MRSLGLVLGGAFALMFAAPAMAQGAEAPTVATVPAVEAPEARKLREEGQTAMGEERYADARAKFSQACKIGSAAGCSNLGALYLGGLGVEGDMNRAMDLFAVACERGDAKSCGLIGSIMVAGERFADGALFLDQACKLEDYSACGDLGTMYARGQGVEKNDMRATALFAKACNGGSAQGCYQMGAQTFNTGGSRAAAMAAIYFRKALKIDPDHAAAADAIAKLEAAGLI